jgi:hypothetical protein
METKEDCMGVKATTSSWEQRFGVYPIDQIALAPWNYKKDDQERARKLVEKLRRYKQIINIVIREYPDDEDHERPYEAVDGNHRLLALQELGVSKVFAYNIGKIARHEAMRLAVEINEGDFEPDILKLSDIIEELLEKWPAADLASTFPYSEREILDLGELKKFEWPALDQTPEEDSPSDDFVKFTALVPRDAMPVILAEIDRIIQHCGYTDKDLEIAKGLALEKICANSATTPLESMG